MDDNVVFYQLSQKFVSSEIKIPEQSRQVIYYSLAIGHHVGVMDCFKQIIEIPRAEFEAWVADLPEGNGKRKLEGISKWGEIEINSTHAADLLMDINHSRRMNEIIFSKWLGILAACLEMMLNEPALYLMGRRT